MQTTPTNEKGLNAANAQTPMQTGPILGQSLLPVTTQVIHSQRQRRTLVALLNGPMTREQIDRESGSSNGPDVVAKLRRKGLDIPCKEDPVTDRDGRKVDRGVYSLTDRDRPRAVALLEAGEGTPS